VAFLGPRCAVQGTRVTCCLPLPYGFYWKS